MKKSDHEQGESRGRSNQIEVALIGQDISFIKQEITDIKASNSVEHKDIKDTIKSSYVTRDEWLPVRNIVYGLVTAILMAVIGALLTLVIRK